MGHDIIGVLDVGLWLALAMAVAEPQGRVGPRARASGSQQRHHAIVVKSPCLQATWSRQSFSRLARVVQALSSSGPESSIAEMHPLSPNPFTIVGHKPSKSLASP